MPQVMPSPKVYDAIIVGSGAGGGMAAYVLTKAGAKCLMLEAGSWYDTAKESKMLEWNYNAPHRGASTPQNPSATSTRRSVAGMLTASPTLARRAATSCGGVRACWAAAPTTGAASRCAWGPTTSSRTRGTAKASTGQLPTTTSRLTTTRPRN